MTDRTVARLKPRHDAALLPDVDVRDIVTASAQLLYGSSREQYAVQYKSWQHELWTYAKSVGEYGGVMDWFAAGISRMHLTAAIQRPGLREPERIEDDKDPAVQLIHRLVINARGGETQYLYKWGRHLGTPGVGYFVGTTRPDGREVFDVKSAAQIRRSTKPFTDELTGRVMKDNAGVVLTGYDVRTAPDVWEKLPYSQLVGRIYRPDDELDYEVTSWSHAALTTLREIDLYNRHIVATLLSRLVFNGILFIPEEVTFPVNPQFKDAPDPFIAELLAIASRGIRDPGSPASALPFPIRVPAQFIEKFHHMILATGVDPRVIEGRAAAVQRLKEQLPAPPEAMSGKGDMNHWSAWKDSEDNVKMYFGPTMEILAGGLTDVYLHPMLAAAGQKIERDGGRIICWYDASDLIVKPDNSVNAQEARDRIIINNDAYLTELGLDKADRVTNDERREMILVDLSRQGMPIPDSYYLLYPDDKPEEPPIDPATGLPVAPAGPSAANGKPVVEQANTKELPPGDAKVNGKSTAKEPARAASSPGGG